jgi:hypothetical protein
MPISVVYDTTCTSTTGKCCAWVVPDGVYSVNFQIWGGGGGGGNGLTMCDCCARTQSGGGGGYTSKTVSVTPGSVYTVCAGNGGIGSDGNNFGASAGYCQNGVSGGTSFVTGAGITTLCATGGTGGCSQFTINCYGHCGCNGALGGLGIGGDVNERGSSGVKGMSGTDAMSSYTLGGTAGGPGGGVGGFNNGGRGILSYQSANSINNPQMHGVIPGGGGAGHGCWTGCVCCDRGSGRGAPGFVKITW